MTSCYILRQKDGPYVVELHIRKLKKGIPELRVLSSAPKLLLSVKDAPDLLQDELRGWRLESGVRDVISHVVSRYAHRSDEELKRIVYLTSPMRQILRQEKYQRKNMFNAAIDFSAVTTASQP